MTYGCENEKQSNRVRLIGKMRYYCLLLPPQSIVSACPMVLILKPVDVQTCYDYHDYHRQRGLNDHNKTGYDLLQYCYSVLTLSDSCF
jgi:hypothetical protein